MVALPGHPYFFVTFNQNLLRCYIDGGPDNRCQKWGEYRDDFYSLVVWGQDVWAGESRAGHWILRIYGSQLLWAPLGVCLLPLCAPLCPFPAAHVRCCRVACVLEPACVERGCTHVPALGNITGMAFGHIQMCPGHQQLACKDFDL